MNIIRNMKMLRAAAISTAATASLPAMLFASAGTAQAETNPGYFTNPAGTLDVIYGGGGLALYATIVDASNPAGATEDCHYDSVGVINTTALPYDADTWVTGPNPSAPVTIIFPRTAGRIALP